MALSTSRFQIVGANIDTWLVNIKGKLPMGWRRSSTSSKKPARTQMKTSPRDGPSLARRSSFAPMAVGGNGAGSCTVRACISTSGGASSTTSSARRVSPQHFCGSTRSVRRCICSTPSWSTSMARASPSRSVRSTCAPTSPAGSSPSTMRPPSSPEATAARRTPRARMRGRRRRRAVCPSVARAEHDGPTLHGLRVQQRGGAFLHDLRQDQGDHRLAQRLDAGGLAHPMAGMARRESPAWSSATSGNASRSSALRIPTSCSTNSRAVGVLHAAVAAAHHPERRHQPWQLGVLTLLAGDPAGGLLRHGTPAVRERKRVGDLRLICQMLSGCSTTAAATSQDNSLQTRMGHTS